MSREHAQHIPGLGRPIECSAKVTEVHFLTVLFRILGWCIWDIGCAGLQCILMHDCQPPWLLGLSLLWLPAGTFLERRDFRPNLFGGRDSPVPLGWDLNSGQSVLQFDSGAKVLSS